MKLKLMTPEGTLFEGEADSVSGRAPLGEFEILPGHATWVSPVGICCLRVRVESEGEVPERSFAVHGGLVEAGPDSVLVLADAAEAPDEIDLDRAERARRRAEERLRRPADRAARGQEAAEVDRPRARKALARARTRIEAASRART
jgi:F-type H+-transporting ATPase subunit epsilon